MHLSHFEISLNTPTGVRLTCCQVTVSNTALLTAQLGMQFGMLKQHFGHCQFNNNEKLKMVGI
jgi:hypothetical protein